MSLFSKKLKAAEQSSRAQPASSSSSSAASSSSSSSSSSSKPWYASVPSARISYGGVEFVLEMSPELCALNDKYDEERKNKRPADATPQFRLTGIILGFAGTTTDTSLVSDCGNVCTLLAPRNGGSKVFRVGDKFTFTLFGKNPLDTSGIAKLRPFANPDKLLKPTTPNPFSGYSESLTYVGVAADSVKKIVGANNWSDVHSYNVAKLMECTLRPLHPDMVPKEREWKAYADIKAGGDFSSAENGMTADETAAHTARLLKKLEGKTEEEKAGIIKADSEELKVKQAAHTKSIKKIKEDAQGEAWKNSIPLGHPLARWRRAFFPGYITEIERNGEIVGTTSPVVTTTPENAFVVPSEKFFSKNPTMPYDEKPGATEKDPMVKVPIMPHLCIEVAQQVFHKPAGASDEETDALGVMYVLWAKKLSPIVGVREPHTLYNLVRAYLPDYKVHVCASADIEQTIRSFPSENVTSANEITGRPWSVVHMDVFSIQSSPIDFFLTRGYEVNSKALIYLLNLYLSAIGEPVNPVMVNTGCYRNDKPTKSIKPIKTDNPDDSEKPDVCNPNYRRVLKYISGLNASNTASILNLFETGGIQRVHSVELPPLDESEAFFLVPMRAFEEGEFGYRQKDQAREANLRSLYQKVYKERTLPQEEAVGPANGISERIMSGDPEQFALGRVFAEDGWAYNFAVFQVPRSVLRPNNEQQAETDEITREYAYLIENAALGIPHADSPYFSMPVEDVFADMSENGKNYALCMHRDIGFHEALMSREVFERLKRQRGEEEAAASSSKRQRRPEDDDHELELAMLEAAAQQESLAIVDDDENEEELVCDDSIPVDAEYSGEESQEEEEEAPYAESD